MFKKITNFLKSSITRCKPIAKKSVKYLLFLAIIVLKINSTYAIDLSRREIDKGFWGIFFEKSYYEFSEDPEINEIWKSGERIKNNILRRSSERNSRIIEAFNVQIKSKLLTKREKTFLKIEHWKEIDTLTDDASLECLDVDHETSNKIEKIIKRNLKKKK